MKYKDKVSIEAMKIIIKRMNKENMKEISHGRDLEVIARLSWEMAESMNKEKKNH